MPGANDKNKLAMDKAFANLEKAADTIARPDNMRRYGKMAAEFMKLRTRLGYGVAETGARRERLKALKDTYIERRKRDKEDGTLSERTTPSKSNLTRTGQMLDSIEVTDAKKARVVVGPTGDRSNSDLSNADVAGFVAKAGRAFLNLSDLELRKLKNQVRQDFKRFLKGI